jgi:hypothetical protein
LVLKNLKILNTWYSELRQVADKSSKSRNLHVPYTINVIILQKFILVTSFRVEKKQQMNKNRFKINTARSKSSKEKVMLTYCVGMTTLVLAY